MAAKYTPISVSEMDQLLKLNKGWSREVKFKAREYVYEYAMKGVPGATVLVYSSIKETGNSRGRGQDAIRVCVVRGGKGYIKSKRVHRTQNWRKNLQARVMSVIGEAKERFSRER